MWGLVAAGILSSYVVVVMLLGSAYAQAVGVTQVLLAGSAFVALSLLLDTFFINQLHRPGLVSILAWFKFLVGFTLALVLIPRFAEKGAAIAMTVTQILGTAVYVYLYLRVAKSGIKDLFYVQKNDIALLKNQIVAIANRDRATPEPVETVSEVWNQYYDRESDR